MFESTESFIPTNTNGGISNVTDMNFMFYQDIDWESNVKIELMFYMR